MRRRDPLDVEEQCWEQLVLVCRKCSKKIDGGFGEDGDEKLRSVLRAAFRKSGLRRRVRVLEIGCLSVCPDDAVSVVTSARPAEVLVVPAGADPSRVAARLAAMLGPHNLFKSAETPR